MEKHKIDWLNMPGFKGETWNPIIGCSKVSAGCKNCYAEKMAFRINNMHPRTGYNNVISGKKWNGKTHFVESAIKKPLHWKKPRMIFVCSMSDLFHEDNSYSDINKVFKIMPLCRQHKFIILTKRPERAFNYFKWLIEQAKKAGIDGPFLPLLHVYIGVTAENQEMANERIPILLTIPAAKRFLSIEPMLGEIDLSRFLPEGHWGQHPTKGKMFYPKYFMSKCAGCGWIGSSEYWEGGGPIGDTGDHFDLYCPKCEGQEPDEIDNNINWVICGGESGHKARPMHPDWVRSIRDQCKEANVPFFFKQMSQADFKDFKNRDSFPVDLRIHEFPNI